MEFQKNLLTFLFVIFLLNFISPIELNSNIVLNTTSSNSSITFIFNTQVRTILIESNFISLQGINFTNSTGTYLCDDINFSTSNFNLNNSEFNCAKQIEVSVSQGGSSSKGVTYYIYEKNKEKENEILELIIKMRENSQKELEIFNPKNTSINKISIITKENIKGNINITQLKIFPEDCFATENKENLIYKIIQINSTIDKGDLENISLFIEINNSWIKENNISQIIKKDCSSGNEEKLNLSYILDGKNSGVYGISIKEFSTLVIFGEKTENISEKKFFLPEEIFKIEESCFKIFNICWYWWMSFCLILIVIKILRKKLKRKR